MSDVQRPMTQAEFTARRALQWQSVLEEMERFKEALPRLLAGYDGKWVVFKDGAVLFASDDEDAAYAAGIDLFGIFAGFVVKQVCHGACDPIPLNDALLLFPGASVA